MRIWNWELEICLGFEICYLEIKKSPSTRAIFF